MAETSAGEQREEMRELADTYAALDIDAFLPAPPCAHCGAPPRPPPRTTIRRRRLDGGAGIYRNRNTRFHVTTWRGGRVVTPLALAVESTVRALNFPYSLCL